MPVRPIGSNSIHDRNRSAAEDFVSPTNCGDNKCNDKERGGQIPRGKSQWPQRSFIIFLPLGDPFGLCALRRGLPLGLAAALVVHFAVVEGMANGRPIEEPRAPVPGNFPSSPDLLLGGAKAWLTSRQCSLECDRLRCGLDRDHAPWYGRCRYRASQNEIREG